MVLLLGFQYRCLRCQIRVSPVVEVVAHTGAAEEAAEAVVDVGLDEEAEDVEETEVRVASMHYV